MSSTSVAKSASAVSTNPNSPVIVDLGKHKKKQIKRLRRGEGKLLTEVQAAVAELKAAGHEGPVVVLVREKTRSGLGMWPLG